MADVALAGTLINQPPTARAGDSRSVECTSSSGAAFGLDGTGSSDPDGDDIRLARWFAGDRNGSVVGSALMVPGVMLGVGGAETYLLRVIDSFARSDEDTTTVAVVDTTAPTISCNTPATINPTDALDEDEPEAEPIVFTATATDTCDADVVPEIVWRWSAANGTSGRDRASAPACRYSASAFIAAMSGSA